VSAGADTGPIGLVPALVAIETATETVGVAVRTPAGVQAEFALTGRRRHVETLTPALEHLLAQVGLVPGDLGAVAVDVGPGLFTGLRVGVAAAKALAQSLGIGVFTATSLDILTAAVAASGQRGLVLACVDARRGEVFASLREIRPDGTAGGERVRPGLFAPGDLGAASSPGWTAWRWRRRIWGSHRPPCCSGSHWRTFLGENRQTSPRRSFPCTCVRRTHRAILRGRIGPETEVMPS
jgi:tRNA threonylcarbamoyl adenosine modification protein YeaZ